MSTRGRFVVFEGIDGCGKSTQARRVAEAHAARFTFEPGDTPLGARLRTWLLDAHEPMSPETEALLMLADRSHHVRTVIEPTLRAGIHVVSDRFSPSTLAYQGHGRGVDLSMLRIATELAVGETRPDVVVLLDIPVSLGRERGARRDDDRFESAELEFHERVRSGYLTLAAADPKRWVVIEASGDRAHVDVAVDEALAGLW